MQLGVTLVATLDCSDFGETRVDTKLHFRVEKTVTTRVLINGRVHQANVGLQYGHAAYLHRKNYSQTNTIHNVMVGDMLSSEMTSDLSEK